MRRPPPVQQSSRYPPLFAGILIALCTGGTSCGSDSGGTPERDGAGVDPGDKPNVIVIVLDTLRRDATGLAEGRIHDWPTLPGGLTPNLDRFAADSATFTRAYSAAPWTVPAHASLFTGLIPSSHGCVARRPRLGDVGPTLAELLGAAGYATVAFFSNPWLSDRATGLLRGFETRVESPIGDLGSLTSPRGDQGGAATLEHVESWLKDRDPARPFFLFVNFLEAHLPYDPPPGIRALFSPPLAAGARIPIEWAHEFNAGLLPPDELDWTAVRSLYAGDVRAADELLGRLLALLGDRGVLADAAVFVTSDHGENLGDHGLVEHQFSVHESLLAVPLVVRLPGGALPPGRYDAPVMTTDVFATVAELAGLALPAARPHSIPLARSAGERGQRRPIIAEYSLPNPQLIALLRALNPDRDTSELAQGWRTVRVGRLRLTVGSSGQRMLHDVVADRAQVRDLSGERRGAVARLGRVLLEALPKSRATATGPRPVLDPATREQLEALGYATSEPDDDSHDDGDDG